MGTNFYICCSCCGSRIKHIGKASIGWPFTSNYASIEEIADDLQTMNELAVLSGWDGYPMYEIRDEYGKELEIDDFSSFIEKREFKGKALGWTKIDRKFC